MGADTVQNMRARVELGSSGALFKKWVLIPGSLRDLLWSAVCEVGHLQPPTTRPAAPSVRSMFSPQQANNGPRA